MSDSFWDGVGGCCLALAAAFLGWLVRAFFDPCRERILAEIVPHAAVDDPFLAVRVRNVGRVGVYLKLVELTWKSQDVTYRCHFQVPALLRFPGGHQEIERSGRTCPDGPLHPGEECLFVLFDLLPLERRELCTVPNGQMWITIYSPAREIGRISGSKILPVLVQLARIWLPRPSPKAWTG